MKSLPTMIAAAAVIGVLAAAQPAPTWADAASNNAQDRADIEELMARYEFALDAGDAKAYAALFTPDGTLASAAMEMKGRAAIEKAIVELVASFTNSGPPGSQPHKIQHIQSAISIEIKGGRAVSKSFWTEIWSPTGKGLGVRAAGHYEDVLVKRGGKWWFQRRKVLGDFAPAV